MALTKEVMLKILATDSDAQEKLDAIAAKADELRADNPELIARINTAEASAKLSVFRDQLKEAAGSADEVSVALNELSAAQSGQADTLARLNELQADETASAADVSAALDANSAAYWRVADAQTALQAAYEKTALAASEASDAQLAAGAKATEAGAAEDESAGMMAGAAEKFRLSGMAMLGVGVAIGAIGYESIKSAVSFQRSMEMISTQAGVPQKALAALKTGVLQLAGQVGESPTSLAAALYHIESSFQSMGITGSKALSLLRIAAEGAQVGGADLVDTTNALDATIVAGIPGIRSFGQAMGVINAVVGSGDMTMEDLTQAMGSGAIAVAKTYGQNIYQVGAALAVFGDNNIRGAKAATDLRMAWQAVMAPIAAGIPVLNSIGLSQEQLANTMEHHGLSMAIGEFIDHLKASKVPMSEWGQLETEIFGKKAGVGIGILVSQYDRLLSKFPDMEKGAKGFGSAWDRTKATVAVELDQLKGTFETLMITIGDKVLPVAESFLKFLADHSSVVLKVAAAVGVLVGALAVLTLAEKAVDAVGMLVDAGPVLLAVAAVAALGIGLYELYKHFKTVRDVVADAGHALSATWKAAMMAAGAITKWFADGPLVYLKAQTASLTAWWKQNGAEIDKIWHATWAVISVVAKVYIDMTKVEIKVFMDILKSVFEAGWDVISRIVKMNWDVMATLISTTIHVIEDVISAVLDVIQGKWSAAGHELMAATSTAFHGIVRIIETIVSNFGGLLVSAGGALIHGLISGIDGAVGGLLSTVSNLGGMVSHAFGAVLKIFSPSKVFRDHGHMIVEGLRLGIEDYAPQVMSAAQHLAAGLSGAVSAGQYRGGAGAGAVPQLQVTIDISGGDSELTRWLRNRIRIEGGDPRIISKKVKFA